MRFDLCGCPDKNRRWIYLTVDDEIIYIQVQEQTEDGRRIKWIVDMPISINDLRQIYDRLGAFLYLRTWPGKYEE